LGTGVKHKEQTNECKNTQKKMLLHAVIKIIAARL
jgi:hypothetical protein